jgi:uncharacterized protein involved in type VI secretion and phage assembly
MTETDSSASRTGIHRGVAVGIVTANDDPDGLGRVKVTYPWRESEDESYWARVATPMAGEEMGTYFLPQVDDEVLVAFDGGDIDHPYVVGALWNSRQSPPEDNADGNNDVRTIKSRSDHQFTFDDSDTEANVEITTGAGHTIRLDDSSGSETITIEDSAGQNSIEFDATQGSLDISGGTKLSVEAPQIDITADGNATVEAGGVLTLKGALVRIN